VTRAAAIVLAATFALAAPAFAQTQPGRPGLERALLVVEFTARAKFIGFPKHCPGATEEEEAEGDVLCTAALYEGPVRIVQRLAGSPAVKGKRLRYTAHAYPMVRGMRLLVLAYVMPENGNMFAPYWEWPGEEGDVCLDAKQAAALEVTEAWQHWRERAIIGEGDGKRYPVRCTML
jgi:hypothetical protein